MSPHDLPFLVGESGRACTRALGNPELADIVEQGTAADVGHLQLVDAEGASKFSIDAATRRLWPTVS